MYDSQETFDSFVMTGMYLPYVPVPSRCQYWRLSRKTGSYFEYRTFSGYEPRFICMLLYRIDLAFEARRWLEGKKQ